jgi:hypothetical protein
MVAGHNLGNISTNTSISGVGDFDLDGDADGALHFDSGSVRNYLTLETENHAPLGFHTLGGIGAISWWPAASAHRARNPSSQPPGPKQPSRSERDRVGFCRFGITLDPVVPVMLAYGPSQPRY